MELVRRHDHILQRRPGWTVQPQDARFPGKLDGLAAPDKHRRERSRQLPTRTRKWRDGIAARFTHDRGPDHQRAVARALGPVSARRGAPAWPLDVFRWSTA